MIVVFEFKGSGYLIKKHNVQKLYRNVSNNSWIITFASSDPPESFHDTDFKIAEVVA